MKSSKYLCLACGTPISQTNYLISKKNHKLSLCLAHQNAVKGTKATIYAKKLYLALICQNVDAILEYNDKGKKRVDIALPGKIYIEVEGRHHREPKHAFSGLERILYSLQDGMPTISIPNELIHDNRYFPLAVKSIVELTKNLKQRR